MKKGFRAAVGQIPGARSLYALLYGKTQGSWLFTQANLAWLQNRECSRQLPFLYRVFAIYCAVSPRDGDRTVRGAESFLRAVISVSRWCGLQNWARLQLAGRNVFLCLEDPRFLAVPNELSNSPEIGSLREFIARGDTFMDIGANHGSFSIVASEIVGLQGLVVAVEPQPRMAELVRKSLALNARSPFEVHQVACSDTEGTMDFYVPKATSGSASLYEGYSEETACERITVQVRKLDDLVKWEDFPGKAFVKLDVEGAETAFLTGAREMLRRRRPLVMLEVNESSMRASSTSPRSLVETLMELGYGAYREIGEQSVMPMASLDVEPQRNIVALPMNPS